MEKFEDFAQEKLKVEKGIGEITENESRLNGARNAMKVLEFLSDRDLPVDTSLEDLPGILDEELGKPEPGMNIGEIVRAKDFLLELDPQKYSPGMQVDVLRKALSKEDKELL